MIINHDPVMTLTYFKTRSTWVVYAFEWGKLLKCHLKGKTCKKLANGQNIDYFEKKKRPWASSALLLGLYTKIVKHVDWYIGVRVFSGPLVLWLNKRGFKGRIYFIEIFSGCLG